MASSPRADAPARPSLVRAIGRWDLTAAIVNGVVGSAVFGMPATQAALTGEWSHWGYLVAGLIVLLIVLCFAEVASRFQDAGGPYLYASEAFGPMVGFQAGWLTFWIRVTALAAALNVLVEYLAQVLPATGTPHGRVATMTGVIALITVVNLAGVRQATWTVDLFTVAKLLPLVGLVVIGLFAIRTDVIRTQAVASTDWAQAILLLIFAYGGFESPLIAAGEARNPRRDAGFALLVALGAVAVVYTLVQLVVIGVVPDVAGVKAPVAAALGMLVGTAGITVASLAAVVSIYGYATGSVLQAPRLLFSMSERGDLPRILSRVHPRFRTPDVSILCFAAFSLALALHGTFAWNATLSAIVRLVTYGLTCAAVLVFRRRPEAPPAAFRIPAGAAVAIAAIGVQAWLLSTRTFAQAGILVALMAAGAILWWASRGRRMEP
jgi:amino acid transporter